jgi:hypothetical protein
MTYDPNEIVDDHSEAMERFIDDRFVDLAVEYCEKNGADGFNEWAEQKYWDHLQNKEYEPDRDEE